MTRPPCLLCSYALLAVVMLVIAWLLLGCSAQCWTLDETGAMVACGEVEN